MIIVDDRITKIEKFGILPSGEEILKITINNKIGMELQIITLGATIHRLYVPDRLGVKEDVILGKTDLMQYMQNPLCNSSVIGRCANRVVPGGYVWKGKTTVLEKSYGNVTLHGASGCYAMKIFEPEVTADQDFQRIILKYHDSGEGGFNGEVQFSVAYTLYNDGTLELHYCAVPSEDTILNTTSHAYFNLAGHNSGTIYNQTLQVHADYYLPAGADGTPTGEILSVDKTDFDFRNHKAIGKRINSRNRQIAHFGGFDHCYCIIGRGLRKAASLFDSDSGRNMEVWTDMPGIQLFTLNNLQKPVDGKDGSLYNSHSAICLETQQLPNAVHFSHFPCPVYPANLKWESMTKFVFSIKK